MDALVIIIGIALMVLFLVGGAIGADSRESLADDHRRSQPEGI